MHRPLVSSESFESESGFHEDYEDDKLKEGGTIFTAPKVLLRAAHLVFLNSVLF